MILVSSLINNIINNVEYWTLFIYLWHYTFKFQSINRKFRLLNNDEIHQRY